MTAVLDPAVSPTMDTLVRELLRLSAKLDDAIAFLHRQASEWSEAEDAYRMARAKLVAEAPEKMTVDRRAAWVDERTSTERRRAHLADAMRQAGLEAVRSRRAQLSATQSVAAAMKSEMQMARYGPGDGP